MTANTLISEEEENHYIHRQWLGLLVIYMFEAILSGSCS